MGSLRDKSRVRSSRYHLFANAGAYAPAELAFHAYADQLPILIWQQDTSGAVCFTNAEWHRATGLPNDPSSHTIEGWKKIVHPDDFPRVLRIMTEAALARSAYEFEWRGKRVGGSEDSYRWYFARAVPRFEGTEFAGWMGSCVDVHEWREREEVERALREEAITSKRALADALPVIVWTADANGWIDWYNRGWYDYTGQTYEQAAGWGWQAAHHPDDFLRVMQEWPRSIRTGEPFEMEFRLRRHDGVFRTFLTRIHPFRNERGEIIRWYGSNVDIQEQKDALMRMQRIAETLQGVSVPELPHTENMRVDAAYKSADKDSVVGGDWFDAMQLRDGRYLVSIGDVAGHGLDGSIIAGRLRTAIRDFALGTDNPAEVLRCTNHVLYLENPNVFATALVGFIDPGCSRFWYASAGHPPPLLAQTPHSPATTLAYGGLLLGVVDELDLTTQRLRIKHDDVLAFYTDGMTEFARDVASAEEKLRAAVARLVGNTSVARPAALVRDDVLGGARTTDDAVLLVVQFSRVTDAMPALDLAELTKTWRFHSSDAHTAHKSRLEVAKFIRRFAQDPDAAFTAELILGEIIANAVEHAPGLVEIRIDWTGEKPIVTVRDTGEGLSHLLSDSPEDSFDETGRGLFPIEALAEHVSVSPSKGYGTELRATLPLTRA